VIIKQQMQLIVLTEVSRQIQDCVRHRHSFRVCVLI